MTGQQIGQCADLASAHRIGLAGERQRTGARAPDLGGGQMQADQGRVLLGAAARLVQALAIQRQHAARLGPPARRGDDVFLAHPAHARHGPRAGLAHDAAQGVKAVSVRTDPVGSDLFFPDQPVQHRVEKRHVGAWQDRQMQVGRLRGHGAPRIDDDHPLTWPGRARGLDPPHHDRVGIGGVRSGDEQQVGLVDVLVAGGHRVGAQRGLVARHRRTHAQARVGVQIVGADRDARQLVEHVIVFGEQLPGAIEGHCIGAVLAHDVGEAVGRQRHRLLPADRFARSVTRAPDHRMQQPPAAARALVQRAALAAQAPEIGRVLRIAAHRLHDDAVGGCDDPAAHAAVGTGGAHVAHRCAAGGGHGAGSDQTGSASSIITIPSTTRVR
jgi:hypothetical protein